MGEKVARLRIIASKDTVDKFKKIVLAKHGKMELSVEGEEALRLYIERNERLLRELCRPEEGPLIKICSIGRSASRRNVLEDLERLEAGEV